LKIRQQGREGSSQALTLALWIHKQALTIEQFCLALRKAISKTGNGEIFKSKTIDYMSKPIQRLGDLGYRLNCKCSGGFQITPYAGKRSLFFVLLKKFSIISQSLKDKQPRKLYVISVSNINTVKFSVITAL